MINLYDIAYRTGLALSFPFWGLRTGSRRKVFRALREKGGYDLSRDTSRPAVMIHAVSLGEMNATRALVASLRKERPGMQVIVSTSTDSGFNRAQQLYGTIPDVIVIRYPLDFTPAITRTLNSLRPDVVALMELEVWPNFMRQCDLRNIPVLLINGRLTHGSYKGYAAIKWFIRPMFQRLSAVCAQEKAYADRFIKLGAISDRVTVTGTMKFDTAEVVDQVAGVDALASDLGLSSNKPLWVCGSTGPGEEAIVLPVYRNLLAKFPDLRLAVIPRHPERFDEVASLIEQGGFPLTRRSNPIPNPGAVILGDTMGELRKFYSLATVVFVGRSLVDLGHRQHGSDMIEPAALAKPVIVGPYTHNFSEVMNAFRAKDAIKEVPGAMALETMITQFLKDPDRARATGARAREVVRAQQGATERHLRVILDQM